MRARALLCCLLLLSATHVALRAQVADTGAAAEAGVPQPDSAIAAAGFASVQVFLLTIGQGDDIWERFGHNAIQLRDTVRGLDVSYNWGMFSFDQPNFVGRLLQGRMLYWMQPLDTRLMLQEYERRNRTVWSQELALADGQKAELIAFLDWNARPENAEYLYDYFRDNCSTRVRDALNRVLGGQLRNALEEVDTENTYRSHSLRLIGDVGAYAGLLLALGPPTDRPLSRWEEAFIPMELRDAIATTTVVRRDGSDGPLVIADSVVFQATREPTPSTPPDRFLAFLAIGLVLAALFLGIGHRAAHSRAARIALAIGAFLWALNIGVFGTVIGALWAFTDHVATFRNENLFVANPLALLLAALVVPAVLMRRALRPAFLVAGTIAALAALGVLLQVLPGLDQQNGEILALTVPVHIALAAVLYLWWREGVSTAVDMESHGEGTPVRGPARERRTS